MHKSNIRENKSHIPHACQVGEPILIKGEQRKKFRSQAHSGPQEILEVKDNGTVVTTDGTVTDTYNVRNIHPHKD